MAAIDHVTLRVSDPDAARTLFTQAFELLELAEERYDSDFGHEWGDFSIAPADDEHPPTQGVHIGFAAKSRAQVDNWWRTLTAAGYRDDGTPGPRPRYSASYYGAFIRDHHDNSIEAVHHDSVSEPGAIDHVWIRVGDLDATKRFYTAVAPTVGVEAHDRGNRLHLITQRGSMTLLHGAPTENLHLAFGADDQDAVRAFHNAGLSAGARDNGAPGERPQYHPGYYGAYLLDPDSNNIEAVFHDRSTTTMSATA